MAARWISVGASWRTTAERRQRARPSVDPFITLTAYVPRFLADCREQEVEPNTLNRYGRTLSNHILPHARLTMALPSRGRRDRGCRGRADDGRIVSRKTHPGRVVRHHERGFREVHYGRAPASLQIEALHALALPLEADDGLSVSRPVGVGEGVETDVLPLAPTMPKDPVLRLWRFLPGQHVALPGADRLHEVSCSRQQRDLPRAQVQLEDTVLTGKRAPEHQALPLRQPTDVGEIGSRFRPRQDLLSAPARGDATEAEAVFPRLQPEEGDLAAVR